MGLHGLLQGQLYFFLAFLPSCYLVSNLIRSFFWNITPYNPVKIGPFFEDMYHLHLMGEERQAKYQKKVDGRQTGLQPASCWYLASLTFQPKRRLTSTGLHGVTSQKNEIIIATAVRT
jgi:hypothetical protein